MSADRETLLALLAEAREALNACVTEYPVASGLAKPLPGDEDICGYGSLKAARATLSRIDDALAADVEAKA